MSASPAPMKRVRNRRMSTGARDLQSELLSHAKQGNMKEVKMLVEMGANINATDALGQTALHVAAYNDQAELCEYLVLNGVDTDIKSNDGLTAYQLAMEEELEDVARTIRERSRDVKSIKAKNLAPAVQKQELKQLWVKAQRKRGVVEEKADAAAAVRVVNTASTVARQTGGAVDIDVPAASASGGAGKKKKDLGLIDTPKKVATQETVRTVEVEEDSVPPSSVKLPSVPGAQAAPAQDTEAADAKRKVPPPPKRPSAPGGMGASAYVQAVMQKATQAASGAPAAAGSGSAAASPLAKRVVQKPAAPAAAPTPSKLPNPGYLAKLSKAKAEAKAGHSSSAFGTETVRLWLGALALEEYSKQLCENGYDSLARLCMLEEEDLKEFNSPKVLPGHRRHLMRAVKALQEEVASSK
ncbi:Espnl [Symbiodinium sp. KB8]|nr:Espnl [Symbiodinium sp. KB8]